MSSANYFLTLQRASRTALALHKSWQLGLLIQVQISRRCLCVLATACRKELAARDGLVHIVHATSTIRLILHATLCDPLKVAEASRVLHGQWDGCVSVETLWRCDLVEAS